MLDPGNGFDMGGIEDARLILGFHQTMKDGVTL